MSGALTDITEKIKAEDALKVSEENFRRAFDDAGIGMLVGDIHGSFKKVNKAFCQMLGYTEEEIIDRHVSKITHPDDIKISLDKYSQLLNDPKLYGYHLDKRLIHKDGRTVWTSLNVAKVYDADGNFMEIRTQVDDITEQKLAQEALKVSEEKFKDFAESTADRFWETDENFKYVYASEVQANTANFMYDDVIGLTRWEISNALCYVIQCTS